MQLTVEDENGEDVTFSCADSLASRMTSRAILEGMTYPALPFVEPVRIAMDIGANCGAMSVVLARRHPDAVIHAFEPGHEALGLLEANVGSLPNVVVHPLALGDRDGDAALHVRVDDLGQSTLLDPVDAASYEVQSASVRHAGRWAAEAGITEVDVLKIDVEGLEVEVLRALAPLLPRVKVLYLEYEGRRSRRAIEDLLAPTHDLYWATVLMLDQGECTYVRSDLADHPEATPRLREVFGRWLGG